MLRTDYCIVLHRYFQKEWHLKKEGKVHIMLGKWEISALNLLCLHIWKLYKRGTQLPISHCLQGTHWPICCETKAPTKWPEKSPISSSRNHHLEQKTIIFFFSFLFLEGLETTWTCAYTLQFPATPAPMHLVLPPLGSQRSKKFLSEKLL